MLRRSGAALQHLIAYYGRYGPLQINHRAGKTAILHRSTATVAPSAVPSAQQPMPAPAPVSGSEKTLTWGSYWETSPPSASQLREAERFFTRSPSQLSYSTTEFRTVKMSSLPEVAFLGRSNVGKSSLLNAVMASRICHTSKRPGRTRTMNFLSVGGDDGAGNPGKLMLLDMPGYGKGSRVEWGREIVKYLAGRRQYVQVVLSDREGELMLIPRLKRAFLLIDPHHGLKGTDRELLQLLRQKGISHQVILSKADRIVFPNSKLLSKHQLKINTHRLFRIFENIRKEIQPAKCEYPVALGELIACSVTKSVLGERIGINNLRRAILAAAGLHDKKKPSTVQSLIDNFKPIRTDHQTQAANLG